MLSPRGKAPCVDSIRLLCYDGPGEENRHTGAADMAERTLFLRRAAAGVLAAVMVLLLFPGVSLASELIGSEEELLAMLSLYRAHGTADFDMALTGGFFGRISEDNFREFRVIALKAGLADYSLKYSSQGGL